MLRHSYLSKKVLSCHFTLNIITFNIKVVSLGNYAALSRYPDKNKKY